MMEKSINNSEKKLIYIHLLFLFIIIFLIFSFYIDDNRFILAISIFLIFQLPLFYSKFRLSLKERLPLLFFIGGGIYYLVLPILFWKFLEGYPYITKIYGSLYDLTMSKLMLKLSILIIISILLVWISYFLYKPKINFIFVGKNIDNKLLLKISFLLIFLGIIGYFLKIYFLGGIKSFFSFSWGERVVGISQSYAYASYMSIFLEVGLFLLLSSKYNKNIFYILGYIIAIFITFYLGGARIDVIRMMIIPLLLYYFFGKKQKKIKKLVLIIFLIFVLIFIIVAGTYRHGNNISFLFNNHIFIIDKLDFPMLFDNLLLVFIKVPKVVDYLYGSSYLKFLYLFIPRFIWPQKPIDVGTWITKEIREEIYSKTSAAPTSIGEAYLNFGLLGIVLLSIIIGIFLKAFNYYFLNHYYKKRKFGMIFSFLICFALFEYWRGGFAYWIIKYLTILIPFYVVNILNNKHRY